MRFSRLTAVVLSAAALLFVAGCGDDAATDSTPDASAPAAQTAEASNEITVTADPEGTLSFTETELVATAGKVAVRFDNPSEIVHDVVIEQDGMEVGATDRVTAGTAETEVELSPGSYAYYCSISGHRTSGMEGVLTVE